APGGLRRPRPRGRVAAALLPVRLLREVHLGGLAKTDPRAPRELGSRRAGPLRPPAPGTPRSALRDAAGPAHGRRHRELRLLRASAEGRPEEGPAVLRAIRQTGD